MAGGSKVMTLFLIPLHSDAKTMYSDRSCLVDVATLSPDGCLSIETFDPMLLPTHCCDDFLSQLFLWAYHAGVFPYSTHGAWNGKPSAAMQLDVLPLYLRWLQQYEETNLEVSGII